MLHRKNYEYVGMCTKFKGVCVLFLCLYLAGDFSSDEGGMEWVSKEGDSEALGVAATVKRILPRWATRGLLGGVVGLTSMNSSAAYSVRLRHTYVYLF